MSQFVPVAKLTDLKEDTGFTVEVKGRLIALFRQKDQVYAMDDCCPHMGASLASGAVAQGVVMCPWHGWRFRIEDGAWLSCPKNKVKTYATQIAGEDVLIEVTW